MDIGNTVLLFLSIHTQVSVKSYRQPIILQGMGVSGVGVQNGFLGNSKRGYNSMSKVLAIANAEEVAIKRLEQEMHSLENEKELEEIEEEMIKNYRMVEGDYKVIITVYEASELIPKPDGFVIFNADKEHCNSFVEIQTLDEVKKTNVKKETNNPIFDEHFNFSFKNLKKEDLDNATIKFTVYDRSSLIIKKAVTGVVELDWTSVYFRRNHEVYRGWLTISDPEELNDGVTGYLLVNIAVLGPSDKMVIHDSQYIKDPLTTLEETVTIQKLKTIDYTIRVEVYRAEHLLPIDGVIGGADAFVTAKFSGKKVKSSRKKSANPEWNQLLKIGTSIPTRSKYLLLEVWNYSLLGNDLVGVVKIPFADLIDHKSIGPRWANIYGSPMSGKDKEPLNYATKMQIDGSTIGSHYRGRLLFKAEGIMDMYSTTYKEKIMFKFPFKPVPNVPQRSYTLRASIIQGFQLPKNQGSVQVGMGPYLLTSQKQEVDPNGCCRWFQSIPERKVVFPYEEGNVDQLPDLIVYFNSGSQENTRLSFFRIKASTILENSHTSQIFTYQLEPDRSLGLLEPHESAGFITMKIQLFTAVPPPPVNLKVFDIERVKYQLRVYLYLAQNLPPANVTGDCDAVLTFKCGGQTVESETKSQTRNPTWYSTLSMFLEFQDLKRSVCQRGIVCLVYDNDPKHRNFVGKFWMPILTNNRVHYKAKKGGYDLIYQKPKWFHITNFNRDLPHCNLGKVLVGYSIMERDDACYIPLPKSLLPRAEIVKIQIYIIGLRSLSFDQGLKSAQATISFTNAENYIATIQSKVKNGGCVFNSLFKTNIRVPHNKNLAPFMDISIKASKQGATLSFIGYNSINMYQLIPNFFKALNLQPNSKIPEQNQNEEDKSQQSILNVGRLQKQLDIIKLRRKRIQELQDRDITDRYKNIAFNKLHVPGELGKIHESEENQEFGSILAKFEEEFVSGKEYDYVRELEKHGDRIQVRSKGKDLRFRIEKEFEENEEGSLLNSSVHFSELNKKNQGDELIVPERNYREDLISQESFRKTPNSALEDTRLMSKKIELNSEATLKKSVFQTENRFKQSTRRNLDFDEPQPLPNQDKEPRMVIDGFSLGTSDAISSANKMQQRVIAYDDIKKAYNQQKQHENFAREKQLNSKFAAAVKLSLFEWGRKKKNLKDKETYENFDTDPGEDLDITPEWYKGRRILKSDFQDIYPPTNKLKEMDIYSGGEFFEGEAFRVPQKIGSLKFIVLAYEKETQAEEKFKYYSKIMSPRIYLCRMYFLKGKSLISEYHDKPTTSLRIKYGSQVIDLKDKTYVEGDSNPEYYVCQDVVVELPGPSTIRVEVVEHRKVLKDHVLGYSDIDLEKRYFTKKWHLMLRKPIELRNLYSDYGVGSQGRLETWIEIIERKEWENNPQEKIHPPPHQDFELRVIVWETKDCAIKDEEEECNDVFVRGWVGTCPPQETDVHWRCRGTGSFNWRWKFGVTYPPTPQDVYGDTFTVQIWDKDMVGYNDLIGETRINLNKVHRIIQKAVKRKKPTKALMKIIEKGMDVTDKMYYDVYNEKKLDEFGNKIPQGRVLLSFELVPTEEAKELYDNGTGRSEPNLHPTLPEPEGRLSFNCRHPWEYLKQIFGLKFLKKCSKWCGGVFTVIVLILIIVLIVTLVTSNDNTVKCVLYNETSKTVISSPSPSPSLTLPPLN